MTVRTDVAAASALARRIACARQLLDAADRIEPTGESALFDSLLALVRLVGRDSERAWLLTVALTAAMPEPSLVRTVARGLALREPEEAVPWLLSVAMPLAVDRGNAGADLRVVSDRPVVEVDLATRNDFVTGIQRVARGVAAQWVLEHEIELVTWTTAYGAYRPLEATERYRLVEATGVDAYDDSEPTDERLEEHPEIVVPWGVPVVVIELPTQHASERLAALAEFTSCSVRLVGYDCIPVASAELVNDAEPEKFGHYLELVKHTDRLAAISRTAVAEFEGFNRALTAQGLTGPSVVGCALPTVVPLPETDAVAAHERPVVLCIGSLGRRKNQVALMEAAEMLWREGLDFELRLLGHALPETTSLWRLARTLRRAGRHLTIELGVSDARMSGLLAVARCLVLPSRHEGFGLPVVEALTRGLPVITSDFGSLRELAEGNGGLLVDPENVPSIADALRRLLTDDDLHARLVAESRTRPTRTWTEYAGDLWKALA